MLEVGGVCESACEGFHIIHHTISFRMISKMQVFMMLPVLLLGTVPTIQRSLTTIVHGIKLLDGRVISERVRRDNGSYACVVSVGIPSNPISNVLCADINRVSTTSVLETSFRLNCWCQRVCQSTLTRIQRLHIRHTCIKLCIIRDVSSCWDR